MNPEVAVVIDVLRATTTISWALNNGADSIEVFRFKFVRKSAMNWDPEKDFCWRKRWEENPRF